MWGCFLMSGVKILHFLKDWWKSIPIHQNYTMALNKDKKAWESIIQANTALELPGPFIASPVPLHAVVDFALRTRDVAACTESFAPPIFEYPGSAPDTDIYYSTFQFVVFVSSQW